MRTFLKIIIPVLVLAGIVAVAYQPVTAYWKLRNKPHWRTAEVSRGPIVAVVNSTGTVKPVLQVSVGSFVSGPVQKLSVEFNQEVKQGDLLAEIDPRIYEANVGRDRATYLSREADVFRVKAQLQQAINDEKRSLALRAEDQTFIAQAEIDKYKFSRMSLEAQLKVAETTADQAKASLDYSILQLGYTKILAPVSGVVINRKIDPGQTLAAQFQTPELFIIAPDMKEKMHVHASVDEADIGLIKEAQRKKLPVSFTVDAYPSDIFVGTVDEIRLSYTTTQNVVTYPVIVAAKNPELKLLPGMTANLSFQVDDRAAAVKLPNTALRFFPNIQHVRQEDRELIEGTAEKHANSQEDATDTPASRLSAQERTENRRNRSRRHVWVEDGEFLRAVEVLTGLSDSQNTEMVSGDLQAGDKLVIGIQPTTFGAPR